MLKLYVFEFTHACCIYVCFLYFIIFSGPASGATVAVVAMYPWHSCFLPL